MSRYLSQLENYRKSTDPIDMGMVLTRGWKKHGITYGIKKESADLFTFYLWNTGEGVNIFHPSRLENGQRLYQTGICWSGITIEQLSDHSFIKEMFSLRTEKFNKESNIYVLAEKHFAKKADKPSENIEDYHHAQELGNCAWKSVWKSCSSLFSDPILTAKVKADITSDLRSSTQESIKKKGDFNIFLRSLLREKSRKRRLKVKNMVQIKV